MQQGMNSLLNTSATSSQIPLPHSHQHPAQIQNHPHFHYDPPSSSSSDDFLDQMLSAIPPPSPWSDLNDTPSLHDDNAANNSNNGNPTGFHPFDEPSLLASKLRQHQISSSPATGTGTTSSSTAAVAKLMLQQQLLMAATRAGGVPQNDPLLGSPFKAPSQAIGGEMQALYNGFASGSFPTTGQQHFPHPQAQNFGVMNQQQAQASGSTSGGGGGGVAPAQQPKQRVRARRGQATDPHSIAERLRRERIAERMKALQELVPNANKTDKASMLDEIIDYVKFLQLQVKVLSMSRLGGAAAVAPLVADMSSEGAGGGGDCIQSANLPLNVNQTAASSGDNLTVTEHQVAKLMEEDMGSAMQYLQGKGLCLMPISLAAAISTVTSPTTKNSLVNAVSTVSNNNGHHQHQLPHSNGEGPASPNMSVLTVQSATVSNGVGEGAIKDAASVSKP